LHNFLCQGRCHLLIVHDNFLLWKIIFLQVVNRCLWCCSMKFHLAISYETARASFIRCTGGISIHKHHQQSSEWVRKFIETMWKWFYGS
jgi:hypothetical protein